MPEIGFVMSCLTRYMTKPTQKLGEYAKQVVRYAWGRRDAKLTWCASKTKALTFENCKYSGNVDYKSRINQHGKLRSGCSLLSANTSRLVSDLLAIILIVDCWSYNALIPRTSWRTLGLPQDHGLNFSA
jgi:hypothetical protein